MTETRDSLVRRPGRPRSGYALTGPERARLHQERRVGAGGRVVRVILSAAGATALDALRARGHASNLAAIEAALIAAAGHANVDSQSEGGPTAGPAGGAP